MKVIMKALFIAAAVAASGMRAQAAPPDVTEEEISCAAEDMQLFYYYLAPAPDAGIKERKSKCPGAEAVIKMPDWLVSDLPAMRARKVWKDPEEGELSEAAVWQAPVSALYEFAYKTQKTLPAASTAAAVSPFTFERDYNDMRTRFILGVDRIIRSNLENSFEGRGGGLLSTLNMLMERMDNLADAVSARDEEGFYKSAGETAKLSRELFAQLFSPPGAGGAYRNNSVFYKYNYVLKHRIVEGYRGVSLPVPGAQTLFLDSGDRVDLLVTFEAVTKGDVKEMVTATMLQNVIVLNVSRPDRADETGVVQLLCNPNEAQYAALSLAQSKRVNIIRRAPGDVEMRPMEMASFRKLFK